MGGWGGGLDRGGSRGGMGGGVAAGVLAPTMHLRTLQSPAGHCRFRCSQAAHSHHLLKVGHTHTQTIL